MGHKELYFYAEDVKKYSMLFPFADSAVVSNSQGVTAALLNAQNGKGQKRTFPSYAAYMAFNSYSQVLSAITVGGTAKVLCGYEFGRHLLTAFPSVMTMGVFSAEGPTEKQRQSQRWSFEFRAKGYSETLCAQYRETPQRLSLLNPDFVVRARVKGHDIGYSGTATILIECALTLLAEEKQIRKGDVDRGIPAVRGGVFTPMTVFENTSLVQRLTKAGIEFEIAPEEEEDDEEEETEQKVDDGDEEEEVQQGQDAEWKTTSTKGKGQDKAKEDNRPTDDEVEAPK